MGQKLNLNCCSTNKWTFWKWFQSKIRDSHLEKRRDYHYTYIAFYLSLHKLAFFVAMFFGIFFRRLFETLKPSNWTCEDHCLWVFFLSLDTVKYFAQLFFTTGRLLGVRNFIASGSREKGVLHQLHQYTGSRWAVFLHYHFIIYCCLLTWCPLASNCSCTIACLLEIFFDKPLLCLKTLFRGFRQPTWKEYKWSEKYLKVFRIR